MFCFPSITLSISLITLLFVLMCKLIYKNNFETHCRYHETKTKTNNRNFEKHLNYFIKNSKVKWIVTLKKYLLYHLNFKLWHCNKVLTKPPKNWNECIRRDVCYSWLPSPGNKLKTISKKDQKKQYLKTSLVRAKTWLK